MPDGRMWLKRVGVPSSSYIIQLTDSVVNHIITLPRAQYPPNRRLWDNRIPLSSNDFILHPIFCHVNKCRQGLARSLLPRRNGYSPGYPELRGSTTSPKVVCYRGFPSLRAVAHLRPQSPLVAPGNT